MVTKTKSLFFIFSLSSFLIGQIASLAQGNNPRYSKEIEDKIHEVENNLSGWVQVEGEPNHWSLADRMKYHHNYGLSIAVVHNYKIEWARGYGLADSAENRPVTIETLFQAASISKSLNGVGVLKLVQEKKINLDEDVNHYLMSWKLPASDSAKGKKITVYNLLNHTAGLNVHGFPGYSTTETLPSVIQILDGKKPANTVAIRSVFEPGLRSEYSGGGITISQLIITDVTGRAYDEFEWNEVLKPLGMTNSSYTQPPPGNRKELLATAYYPNKMEVKGKYHIYPEMAAAGLWTNPTDLCHYIIETQLAYEGKSSKVLSQSMTKTRLTPFPGTNAALGVFVDSIGDRKYFQHGGANEGFRCQYYGSLTGGDGVVVMVNSDDGSINRELINSVAAVYGWKDFSKPQIKKLANVPSDTLDKYVGEYVAQGEPQLLVSKNGNDLYLSIFDRDPMRMYFTSHADFFLMDIQAQLGFARNEKDGHYMVVAKGNNHDTQWIRK